MSQRPSFVRGGGSGGGRRTWNGKVHAMIKFQRSGTYEKGDMRLTLKTDLIIIKRQIFVDL